MDEKKIAQIAIDLADRPNQSSERMRHVGYYLVDDGAQELQEKIAFKFDLSGRLRQFFFENNTAFYLGSIFLLTALVIMGLILVTRSYVTGCLAIATDRYRQHHPCFQCGSKPAEFNPDHDTPPKNAAQNGF
jgi:hypothetical protein